MKQLLRQEEVSEGINVIVDNRWAAMFPMGSKSQVDHLVEAVNRAVLEMTDPDGNNPKDLI